MPPRPPPTSTLFPYTTLFRSVFQRKGELDRALVEFGRAAELMPTDSRSHYMLARVLGKLGKQDEAAGEMRSEEHTSELQSRGHLVCRLLLEKKKTREDGLRLA